MVSASAVTWFDWKEFLSQYYDKSVLHMAMYHEFVFRRDQPGVMLYKRYHDSTEWKSVRLWREGVTICKMISGIGYRPLNHFRLSLEEYDLKQKWINRKGQSSITRYDYLQKEVVREFFTGPYEAFQHEFFGEETPSENPVNPAPGSAAENV